jgi:hypothetical protein
MPTGTTGQYLVTAQQVVAAARQAGLGEEQLRRPALAILTFSRSTLERLEELCGLEDRPWISPLHHPYGAAEVCKQGTFREQDVTVLVPAMGASPLACTVEDLVACGARVILLVCAAWSLGEPVHFGDLIVPAFSAGPDGTSIHYGNAAGRVEADRAVVEALAGAGRERGATVHIGGNATCEALYRITPQVVEDSRKQGCLCMENGEASTLLAMARVLGFLGGALFQPYIDLAHGWDPQRLRSGPYRATGRLQAEVALEAGLRLLGQG